MNEHYHRALLLFNRKRHEEAVGELQTAIAENENDPHCHGLLALCLSRLERHQAALESAKRSIEIAPDSSYGHSVLARVYADRGRYAEAREAVRQAIQIDPEEANTQGMLAQIEYCLDHWDAAVKAADAGLALDATEDVCLHFRSLALVKLGRMAEAEKDQAALLAADPNDTYTHMARGWTLLEQGNADEARHHFLESLRLDPDNDDARSGLVNALKARHFIFGLALRLLLYLDRFRTWSLWVAAFVFFFGLHQLDRLALSHPGLVIPLVLIKSAAFTLMIILVVAQPLFGILLRLDPDGRRALSPARIQASNWHVACLLAALALGLWSAMKGGSLIRTLALDTMMLALPVTYIFETASAWVRIRLTWLTVFAALLIPASYILFVITAVLLFRFKIHTVWLIKLSLIYLPILSVVISGFSDDIAKYLHKKQPDSAAD
ncbi:MAG TPA: tetratricopeptide repeat protein [Verrucomicrobiae bacterium]|nr:tetratricopeptide repeat protein [Verrucomicrobiae bacterium]